MLKVTISPISASAISLEEYALRLPLLLTSGSQGLELLPPFLFLVAPLLLGLQMLFLRNPDFQVEMRKIAICSMVNNHGPVRNRILPTNPYVHTKFFCVRISYSQPSSQQGHKAFMSMSFAHSTCRKYLNLSSNSTSLLVWS